MNTEQQLRAEIARLNALLDSVGAGGVGEGKLMPPAAQPADHTATEQEAVDRLIAHVQQHHKIHAGEQRNFEALVASLIVAVRMGRPPAAQPLEFVTYTGRGDPSIRFRQSAKDALPSWALNVRLETPAPQQSAAMPEFDRYEPGYDRDMVRCNNGGFVMFKKVTKAWPKISPLDIRPTGDTA